MDKPIQRDPFWDNAAELPVEVIEKMFPEKTAAALKVIKEQNDKQNRTL